MTHPSRKRRALALAVLAASLGLSSASATRAAPFDLPVALRSAVPQAQVRGVDADVRLLHHTMPGVGG